MLNVMRENLRRLKIVLIVVAVAMVLSLGLFFDVNPTSGGAWAAKVDGEEIPVSEYVRSAQRTDQYYRQLFSDNYDQIRAQIPIGTQAINELIHRRLLIADARRMGLEVSEAELAEAIRRDPTFQDPSTGAFIGAERYRELVNGQIPGGTSSFESLLREDLLVDKWLDVVARSITVDVVDLETLHRQRTEKTAIRFVSVPSADLDVETAVDDDEARAWYEAHSDDYRRDEGRRIVHVVVRRADVAESIEVGEDELRAAYDSAGDEFAHPVRRRARHILLRVDPDAPEDEAALVERTARDVRARIEAGESFEELARATSQDPVSAAAGGDLGYFEPGDMVSEFDAAAFGTPVGELADVVRTQFGFHIIQVMDEQPAGVEPFADVRDGLEMRIRAEKTRAAVEREAARIAEAADDPGALRAVAEREGLPVTEEVVTRGGSLGRVVAGSSLRESIFDFEVGEVTAPTQIADGMAIVGIVEAIPPHVPPFEEVVEQVRTDVVSKRFREEAVRLAREAIDSGRSLDDLAARIDGEVRESGDLAPGQRIQGAPLVEPADVELLLFGDAVYVGDRGVLETPGGAMAYEVVRREPWDAIAFEEARERLRDEVRQQRLQTVRQTILERLREGADIKLNAEQLARFDRTRG